MSQLRLRGKGILPRRAMGEETDEKLADQVPSTTILHATAFWRPMIPAMPRAFVLCLMLTVSLHAQTADTLNSNTALFTSRDALLLGSFALGAAAAGPVDKYLALELQKPARQSSGILRNGATGFRILGHPGALITSAGIYLIGRIDGQRRVEDLGLHSVEAIVIASTVTGAIKTLAGRARPRVDVHNSTSFELLRGLRSDDYRSFPSGHTTIAFAFASIVSIETVRWRPGSRWVVGPLMYGGATLAGLSRMYNNEHWVSDVVAGAAIGTLTGLKVFRYQHSHPGNSLDGIFLKAGIELPNTGGWMPHLSVIGR